MADKYALLTKYLTEQMTDFQSNVPGEGGSPEAIAYTAHGLAKAIIDALPASELHIIGDVSCEQLNAMEKNGGELAVVTDNGTLQGSVPLVVNRGWVVYFDGEKFVKVYGGGDSIVIDNALNTVSANPIANAPVAQAISDLNKRIDEIEPGENVQSDWEQTDTTSPDYIKNKPEIPAAITVDSALSSTSTNPVQNNVINSELRKKVPIIRNASDMPDKGGLSAYEIPDVTYASDAIGAFVILWDITSFVTKEIAKNQGTYNYVVFKGFFTAGKNQGYGTPHFAEMYAKVYYLDAQNYGCYLASSSKETGPRICSREENGVTRYYLGIYQGESLYSSAKNIIFGDFSKASSSSAYSHNNFIGSFRPWKKASVSLWTTVHDFGSFVVADKFFTARDLKVNLASSNPQAFDGSANAESVGVSGTLPITHGGTGATTASAARANLDVYSKSEVSQSITNEATERQQADGELQAQIDAISSKSDVVNVVASYVELISYDTSTLFDNDVIKVLHDETHDDAESYYRWNLTTETWGYIGSQGPFVTPAEMQTALGGKMAANGSNSTSDAFGRIARKMSDWTSISDTEKVGAFSDIYDTQGKYSFGQIKAWVKGFLGSLAQKNTVAKSDLESSVQTSLEKADTALQEHQDISGKQNVDGSNATSAGMSTAINKLATGSEDFKDTDIVIGSNHSGGATDASTFVRRTFLNLYNRIKTKLDSVYAASDHTHSVKINGSTKTIAASGGAAVDLGTYLTSHQDISGKADNTPSFSQASTRANLVGSGETMPTILGKIKKFFSDLKTVAFTGSYSDLSGKPTIPAAANNATLTVKMNGANIGTFTANASADETINLGTVLTQHQDISGKIEVAWKEFGRMGDMTASQRRTVYEEIAELMNQTYSPSSGGAKVLPCIRSGEGCIQFPYEGGYPQRGYIYFAGIFGYTDTNKVIIQTTILYSDGSYEEHRNYLTNKADKPSAYTSGHLAALDSNGDLADSGKAPSDFESSDFSKCQENASGKWYKVATITQKGTNAYCLMCAKIEIMAGDSLWGNNSSQMADFATYDLMIRRNGTSNQHPSGASGNTFMIKKNALYGMESMKISAGFVSKFSNGKLLADIWVKGNTDSTSNYSNNILARVIFAGCGMDTTDKGVTVTYYDQTSGESAVPESYFREATRKVIAATSA